MKTIVAFILVLIALPLCAQDNGELPDMSEVEGPDTAALVAKLRAKYAPVYQKYSGIETTRDFTTKTYDPETKKLLSTAHTVVRKKEYFYKEPDSTVISHEENGKILDPGDYDTTEIEPFWPLFDDKSAEHYDFRVSGTATVENRPCIMLEVTPKGNDYRHFKGNAYITTDTNELLMIEGKPAKPHWAMKEFSVKYLYEPVGGGYCMKRGWFTARVAVFLIRPDRRHVYEVKGSDSKPIPK